MKQRALTLFVSAAAAVLAGCASAPAEHAEHAHWGYSGAGAPENWAKLSGDNFACAGKNQSPINLTGFIQAQLEPLKLSYRAGGNEIVNNGHTIQVNFAPGSTLMLDNISFELKQFHFHAPSENHVQGKSYPLEAHLVHASKDGQLAVVGLMYEEGAENAALKQFWGAMPAKGGQKAPLATVVNAAGMLPAKLDYYRFNGSLTTPPCSEGVRWLVLKAPLTASKAQISAFEHVMHHPNNRPLQPVNARPVLQ
ncbi:carbonic anhydrase [Ottowia testudinis]|uniref:Carbonic anhydrase n=1 Tax=Ottowia testudinis TaxID=2816950 RepID=A0A975H3G3_9BURK|nr:carbonic anhydrase family protein [Ottowia testudinis]QTD45799.1 carbonic anhydrase family protein [Ottowia testudinis]